MRQVRLDTIQEIEDLNHAKDIKKQDDIEANKIMKMNKLRPSMMNKPTTTRIVSKKNGPEDSSLEMEMTDLEADLETGSSITSSKTDLSAYTEFPISECSYIQIAHS